MCEDMNKSTIILNKYFKYTYPKKVAWVSIIWECLSTNIVKVFKV